MEGEIMPKRKAKTRTKATKKRKAPRKHAQKRKAKARTSPKKAAKQKPQEVGRVSHFYTNLNVAIIELSKPLKVGDKIHIQGHTTNFKQTVQSMQIEHKPVSVAKKGDVIGLKVKDHVRDNDAVYKTV